jgi:hypothetical protein
MKCVTLPCSVNTSPAAECLIYCQRGNHTHTAFVFSWSFWTTCSWASRNIRSVLQYRLNSTSGILVTCRSVGMRKVKFCSCHRRLRPEPCGRTMATFTWTLFVIAPVKILQYFVWEQTCGTHCRPHLTPIDSCLHFCRRSPFVAIPALRCVSWHSVNTA